MRTTILLDDRLGEQLREAARAKGLSLSAFLAEAGRNALARKAAPPPAPSFRLITYGTGGAREGVDLDRTGALLVAEDETRYRA